MLVATVGGVRLAGANLQIDGPMSDGTIQIDGTADAIAKLVPGVELPADPRLSITAHAGAATTTLELAGTLGAMGVHGSIELDPDRLDARGFVAVHAADLGVLSQGRIAGRGDVTALVAASRAGARGVVVARGGVEAYPDGRAIVGVDAVAADGGRARAFVIAAGPGAGVVVVADVARDAGGRFAIRDRAHVVATVADPGAASGGRVVATGRVRADVAVRGKLTPAPELRFDGALAGRRLVYGRRGDGAIAVRDLRARLGGTIRPTGVLGHASGNATGVARDREPLGALGFDARDRADGSIVVNARARAAAQPAELDVNAIVRPGEVTEIELVDHRLQTPGRMTFAGRGGLVALGPRRITLRGLRTSNGHASLEVATELDKQTGALQAVIDAHQLDVAMLGPGYRGVASGRIDIKKRGLRWDGSARLTARRLVLGPGAPVVDGEVVASVAGRRVVVTGRGSAPGLGAVRLALDVDGPRDITDPRGWERLERKDVHSATIALEHVDLAGLRLDAVPRGMIDGEILLAGADTRGTLHARGIATPAGAAEGDIAFAPLDSGELGAETTAKLAGVGEAHIAARIAFPRHPFAPAAWKQLGARALSRLEVSMQDVVVDPEKLARLGVDAPYRGRVDVAISVEPGARLARAVIDLRKASGGALTGGAVDAHVAVTADATGTRGCAITRLTAAPRLRCETGGLQVAAVRPAGTLAALDLELPVAIDRWIVAPEDALAAPLRGTLELPDLDARAVLALVRRTDVAGGKLGGKVVLGGTLRVPTARASLVARDVRVAPRVGGRKVPSLTELTIDATWTGTAGTVEIAGKESSGGTLKLGASGAPADLASIRVKAAVDKLELAPLAVFLPERFVAATGVLDADVTVTGLDPAAARPTGRVRLTDARVPLHPMVGTLRRMTASLDLGALGAKLAIDGSLGAGKVKLEAKTGGDLTTIDAKLTLTNVSPISKLEPRISAVAAAKLRRTGEQWLGDVRISDGTIAVPKQKGKKLLDVDAPSDLYFVDGTAPLDDLKPKLGFGRAPERPWLVIGIDLEPTRIDAPDIEGQFSVRGEIEGGRGRDRLTLSYGDSIGLVGSIVIVRADAELFGRRYNTESNSHISFDGDLDPRLAIEATHEFPDLALTAVVSGRLSDPKPSFRSAPATYSEGQLLGFFLGGDPGGDTTTQTRDAGFGAGAALASSFLGARVKKYLPVKVDVIRCQPGSGMSGSSCTIGKWWSDRLFTSIKRKIDARPDENVNDINVQYYLKRDWIFELSGGDRNYNGTDLLWRKRW